MKVSFHRIVLSLIIAGAIQSASANPVDKERSEFKPVLQELQAIVNRVSNLSGTESGLANPTSSLQRSLQILTSRADANPNADYVHMLYADQAAIQRFLTNPEAGANRGSFEAAVEDLRIKAEQARSLSGASAAVGDLVQVSVSTAHDGKVVSGYLVRANPLTVKNENPARFVFNNPTSPSDGVIPPGFIWLWVEKPDGTVVKGQIMRIGGNGSPIQPPITVLIP